MAKDNPFFLPIENMCKVTKENGGLSSELNILEMYRITKKTQGGPLGSLYMELFHPYKWPRING